MTQTLFFYDLETSGFNPREARIMQFAGQRTDMKLKPIGDPVDVLVKLTEDVLPSPSAILLTGITPQKTITEGLSEAEFLKFFSSEVAVPSTIFVGYNSVRFDDEFMRYVHYRNFYDPYEWQWKDGRSRWDLLDIVRMTRALRPDGIKWAVDKEGKATNRLVDVAKVNKIVHDSAHDALSDVRALISVAQLIRSKQPKLFDFLLDVMRDKKKIAEIIDSGEPLIYTTGKYPSEHLHTSAVVKLSDHPKRQGAVVFDLREDPDNLVKLSPEQLYELWGGKDGDHRNLPVKTLQYNRCPAVAPLSVLDESSQKRIDLSIDKIQANFKKFKEVKEELSEKILAGIKLLDESQEAKYKARKHEVDERLYDGFFDTSDKSRMGQVRSASLQELSSLNIEFDDDRLDGLLTLYKARNYPKSLSDEERQIWENFKCRKIFDGGSESRLAIFFAELLEVEKTPKLTSNQSFLIEELKLYGESIIPIQD